MNQNKPKEVKTLSIRIPLALYLEISQYAIDEDHQSLNSAIMALLNSGLLLKQEEDNVIRRFILEIVPQEKLEELVNGEA